MTIDFAGFTGETLHGALQEPLDKIRAGRLTPESVAIRILLPDMTEPAAVPALADGRDDPAVRERAAAIARRHIEAIVDSVHELADLGLVREASVQVRAHSAASLMKLYIVNGEEVFFGFYPVSKHTVSVKGKPTAIRDLAGKDSTLFHFTVDDDDHSIGTPFVEQSQPGSTASGPSSATSTPRDAPRRAGHLVASRRTPVPRLRRTDLQHLRRLPRPAVAAELRGIVRHHGLPVSPELAVNRRPPRRPAPTRPHTADPRDRHALQQAETKAADSAAPTPGGHEVIRAAVASGQALPSSATTRRRQSAPTLTGTHCSDPSASWRLATTGCHRPT